MVKKQSMYKHPTGPVSNDNLEKDNSNSEPLKPEDSSASETEVSTSNLKDLLEKNLKWSQIIYEQNRKINNKLLWSAVANWVRLGLILVPFILALWFLPPIFNDFKARFDRIFPPSGSAVNAQPVSIEEFLNILPLSPEQQAQLKAILGTK